MRKILDFNSYVALNEQEAFYTRLPELAKDTTKLRQGVVDGLKAAGLTVDNLKAGLGELKSGMLRSQLGKDSVKVLQMLLGLKADGAYGPATKEAVKAFQNQVLKFGESDENKAKRPDGIWGPETAKASFGDKNNQGPLYPLLLLSGIEAVGSNVFGAAKEILMAMSGATEDEDAVYNTFKKDIKTKGDFDALVKLWNEMNVNAYQLEKISDFWKNKSIEEIKKVNAKEKDPMTLGDMFRKYFDTEEINRLNSYLPAGVEKF